MSEFKSVAEMERYYIEKLENELIHLAGCQVKLTKLTNEILDKLNALKRGDYRKTIEGK